MAFQGSYERQDGEKSEKILTFRNFHPSIAYPDKKAFQTTLYLNDLKNFDGLRSFNIYLNTIKCVSISATTLSPYAWHEALPPTVGHVDQIQELSPLEIQTSGVLWLICETCPQWPANSTNMYRWHKNEVRSSVHSVCLFMLFFFLIAPSLTMTHRNRERII